MSQGMSSLGSLTYDNLFSGNVADIVIAPGILLSGQNVVRGTCLGIVTASGKLKLLNSANTDGSQNIFAIAAEDTNASAGDTPIAVYYTGEFNGAALTFGGTDTAATHKVAAKDVGIFFGTNVTVGGTY